MPEDSSPEYEADPTFDAEDHAGKEEFERVGLALEDHREPLDKQPVSFQQLRAEGRGTVTVK